MTDRDPIDVDVQAAALYAGVSPNTVHSWIRRGKLTRRGRDGRRTLVNLRDVDRIAPQRQEET